MSNEDSVVYADFSIETRDLFRANIFLARFRLLLGLGLSLCLISGLVLIFVAIDEKTILWETSPLFVAMPLLAVGGQVLRLHATCRQYIGGLTEAQRRMQYMFYDRGDGFDVSSGESFGHISWRDVLRVVEQRDSFQIYLSKYDVRIIPKRGFHQPSDIPRLRAMLSSSPGAKAELLLTPA
ncbi:MAG TPA: YcxB family protein [Pyrinomonadaceae bacterium]|nr:YcxB family protein [Pyrinomonadaceae bacterium]